MKQVDWMRVIGKLDDSYIEEALLTYQDAPSVKRKEIIPMRHTTKKKIPMRFGVLVAVLTMIFALGVTAYATGFADSVIAKMAAAWAVYDADRNAQFEAAAEKSNKEPQTMSLTEMMGNAMTMEESYYDGETLMIVYSLDTTHYPVSFDFGPESENFDKMEKAEGVSVEWLRTQYGISDGDFQTIREKLDTDGKVGFRSRQIGVGDHILLTDGTDIGPMAMAEMDGKIFLECQDGLPEEAKNREQLELVFKIRSWEICHYIDGTDIYHFYSVAEEEKVTFTIPNCNIA